MNFFSNDILYFLKVLDKQNSSPKRRLLRNKKRCDFFRKNWNITVFFHIQILTFSDIMAFCYIGFFFTLGVLYHWDTNLLEKLSNGKMCVSLKSIFTNNSVFQNYFSIFTPPGFPTLNNSKISTYTFFLI